MRLITGTTTAILLLLATTTALTGGALAQQDAPNQPETNQTTQPTTNPTVVGDNDLYITDYWKANGTMFVELYAGGPAHVTLSAPPSGDAEVAGGYVTQLRIPAESYRTVSIRSPGSTVWLSSSDSVRNGRFTRLDVSGPGYWPANFTGLHVLAAALVASLMTGAAVVVDLVRFEFLEDTEQGERLDA